MEHNRSDQTTDYLSHGLMQAAAIFDAIRYCPAADYMGSNRAFLSERWRDEVLLR